MSSEIGKKLKLSIFGESHGVGVGGVIDGFPAGFKIDEGRLAAFMKRRAPGRDRAATPRKESDIPKILSGVKDGITCGTPIAALIENNNQHSQDYKDMSAVARPGHADYTGYLRYHGFNDVRGGGHFSARLTAPLCFAGALCMQYLNEKGIYVGAHLAAVADVNDKLFDAVGVSKEELISTGEKSFPVLDDKIEEKMRAVIDAARVAGDSVGGVVEVAVVGIPAGIGSPIFSTVEGRLSYGFYGIPAVKGVEFGAGFNSAKLRGSENNDAFYMDRDRVLTRTNNHGGILGGISTGMPIIARLAFKPTPSISKEQESIDYREKKDAKISIRGRHDPCVAVRAVPVVEAVMAITLMDMMLEQGAFE